MSKKLILIVLAECGLNYWFLNHALKMALTLEWKNQ